MTELRGRPVLMRLSGYRGGGAGSGRGDDGGSGGDRDEVRRLTKGILAMPRDQFAVVRETPAVLTDRFKVDKSRPIIVEGKRRKHIYEEHDYINQHPDQVVATLVNPDQIRADTRYLERVVFYRLNPGRMDVAVVVEINPRSPLAHRVITAFGSEREWTAKRFVENC